MAHPYRNWLQQHLQEAEAEYNRIQKQSEQNEQDSDLYDRVHQMWGYLAALEKCLKELPAEEKASETKKPAKKPVKAAKAVKTGKAIKTVEPTAPKR